MPVLFNCYDFNHTGALRMSEVSIALEFTLIGCCKIWKDLQAPSGDQIDVFTAQLFEERNRQKMKAAKQLSPSKRYIQDFDFEESIIATDFVQIIFDNADATAWLGIAVSEQEQPSQRVEEEEVQSQGTVEHAEEQKQAATVLQSKQRQNQAKAVVGEKKEQKQAATVLQSKQRQKQAKVVVEEKRVLKARDSGELAELRALFDKLDKDKNGTVDKKEWGKAVYRNKETLSKYFGGETTAEIGKRFNCIDANQSGDLTWAEIKQAAEEHAEEQKQAATVLQSKQRQKQAKAVVGEKKEQKQAATVLQSKQRQKQAKVVVGEKQRALVQESQAATKIQAISRMRSERIVLIKKVSLESDGCLALPGTIQGRSGYYEAW
jgi:Ca2+-binding EF-hand superfamily protein